MRMSQLFSHTLREAPAEAETAGHQLLLRAGFIRQLSAGVFSYLPLALRSIRKIEHILREEMDAIGGQEIEMPVVHPAELWKETGRWYKIGTEMGRFKDKNERDMVLGMTHEEVITDLARREIRSYRQLPLLLYQIQTKWRDDPRPRGGLIRAREFSMKDSYSLDADWEGLNIQYQRHYEAYFRIFHRCGLQNVISVKSDVGMMGGKEAHEYMYLSPVGEDTLMLCAACGYSANRQVARFRKPQVASADNLPKEKVATPGAKTIKDLAVFLGIPESQTAKAVFMIADLPTPEGKREQFVFAVVRGDMEVNETKLANAVGALEMRPAREEEIRAVGAAPGYASPVGLKDVLVVVDDLVTTSPNLAAGANEEGYHFINTNYGHDYTANIVTDIVLAEPGSGCPECGAPLNTVRGVEVGNIFKLGTHFSESMGANYTDIDGNERPIVMGSYGIGLGRLLGCIAEEHHDDYGLIWPVSVAPFLVHLVVLPGKGQEQEIIDQAEQLYEQLEAAGIDTLYDDRSESPGVKFNDADLLGLPVRLTVSGRAMQQGGVEMKRRDCAEKVILPLREIIIRLQAELNLK